MIIMDNSTTPNYSLLEEIKILIYDNEITYYGGNQYWFSRKFHQLSGCGPVAAANLTAYLSKAFPEKFSSLYPYKGDYNKENFMEHMVEIRKYVKPGIFGLTSAQKFSSNVLSFAQSRGVTLVPHLFDKDGATMQEALAFILEALYTKIPVALLVLKHQVKEFKDYTWHWMTITNLRINPLDNKYYISVSSYGEYHEIDLDLLWNCRRKKDLIRLAYFT